MCNVQDDSQGYYSDVIFASKLGIVRAYDCTSYKAHTIANLKGLNITAMCWANKYQSDILIATKDGGLKSFSLLSKKIKDFSLGHDKSSSPVVNLFNCDDYTFISHADGSAIINRKDTNLSMKFSEKANRIRFYDNYIATGGRDENLKVYDINSLSSEPIFTAKNCRNDILDLAVPVWISDISFVPEFEGKLICIGSRIGEVQFYDIRTGSRRPVSRTSWRCSRKHGKIIVGSGESRAHIPDPVTQRPITRVAALPFCIGSSLKVLVGNYIGDISVLDCRMPEACLSTSSESINITSSIGSKGPLVPDGVKGLIPAKGAITSLITRFSLPTSLQNLSKRAEFLNENYLMVASLDRSIRIHKFSLGDLYEPKRIKSIYLKIQPDFVLIKDSASFKNLEKIVAKKEQEELKDKTKLYYSSAKRVDEENNKLYEELSNQRKAKKRQAQKEKEAMKNSTEPFSKKISKSEIRPSRSYLKRMKK